MNRRGVLALAAGALSGSRPSSRCRRRGASPSGALPPEPSNGRASAASVAPRCPTHAIRFPGGVGLDAGHPFLALREAACVLCMACTEVCPTGALARIPPVPERVAAEVSIGVAVLDRGSCLPWSGQGVCRLCAYVCPMGTRAVELVGPQQAPLFHPEGAWDVGCARRPVRRRHGPSASLRPERWSEVAREPAPAAIEEGSAPRRTHRRCGGGCARGGRRCPGSTAGANHHGPMPLLPPPLRPSGPGVRDHAPARRRRHWRRDPGLPLPSRARPARRGALARPPPTSAPALEGPAGRDLLGRGARVHRRADAGGAGPVGPEAVAFQTGWPLVRHPLMDWIRGWRAPGERRTSPRWRASARPPDGWAGAHRGQQVSARLPAHAHPRHLGQ